MNPEVENVHENVNEHKIRNKIQIKELEYK